MCEHGKDDEADKGNVVASDDEGFTRRKAAEYAAKSRKLYPNEPFSLSLETWHDGEEIANEDL